MADLSSDEDTNEPVRLRDDFLSGAEISFYHVLRCATEGRFVVCPKVGLRDIFYVPNRLDNLATENRFAMKHVDFLLCDTTTMIPRLGVELDDSSHMSTRRQKRDSTVERFFADAGLPLLRVPASHAYDPRALVAQIDESIASRVSPRPGATLLTVPAADPVALVPSCPKCGVPMVLRTAKRGKNHGASFYGCPNYPKCKQIVDAAEA